MNVLHCCSQYIKQNMTHTQNLMFWSAWLRTCDFCIVSQSIQVRYFPYTPTPLFSNISELVSSNHIQGSHFPYIQAHCSYIAVECVFKGFNNGIFAIGQPDDFLVRIECTLKFQPENPFCLWHRFWNQILTWKLMKNTCKIFHSEIVVW